MAARLRRDLRADVNMIPARYGEFKVLVDGDLAINGGPAAFLGVLPSYKRIFADVRERLSSAVRK